MVIDRQVVLYIELGEGGIFPQNDLYPANDLYPQTNMLIIDSSSGNSYGIESGSVRLDEAIVDNEIEFGMPIANMFECLVYGIEDYDLAGKLLTVTVRDNNIEKPLFKGYIDSCKRGRKDTSGKLIAYDFMYYHSDDNVADWWTTFWTNRQSATLKQLRESLLTYVGIEFDTTATLINDSMTVEKYSDFTQISFNDMLRMICEVSFVFPNMDRTGKLEFITLDSTNTIDLTEDEDGGVDYEGSNAQWEDYTTQEIVGIKIYDGPDTLLQLVGQEGNCYSISGNVLILGKTAQEITSLCQNLLNSVSGLTYNPCQVPLLVSDFSYTLGKCFETDNGISYIMQNSYSGVQLVDQTLSCVAMSEMLPQEAKSYNQEIIIGRKISKFEQDIDHIEAIVGDESEGLVADMTLVKNEIVLKVDDNGRMVQVELSADPDDGTEFKVGADNIEFIANDVMRLGANNISIDAKNFSVDNTGYVKAGSGYIGCMSIDGDDLKIYELSFDYLPVDSDNKHYYEIQRKYTVQTGENTYEYYQVLLRGYPNNYTSENLRAVYFKYKAKQVQSESTAWSVSWDDTSLTEQTVQYYYGDVYDPNPPADSKLYTLYFSVYNPTHSAFIEYQSTVPRIWRYLKSGTFINGLPDNPTQAVWNSEPDGTGTDYTVESVYYPTTSGVLDGRIVANDILNCADAMIDDVRQHANTSVKLSTYGIYTRNGIDIGEYDGLMMGIGSDSIYVYDNSETEQGLQIDFSPRGLVCRNYEYGQPRIVQLRYNHLALSDENILASPLFEVYADGYPNDANTTMDLHSVNAYETSSLYGNNYGKTLTIDPIGFGLYTYSNSARTSQNYLGGVLWKHIIDTIVDDSKLAIKTEGGSFISQKDIYKSPIRLLTKAVTDGSRYDSIIAGQSTDNSTWSIGVINNTIKIGRFASNQTSNAFTAYVDIDLINGYVSKANTANSATTAGSCTGNAATATTASSCSGNAATATNATKLNGYGSDTANTANTVVRRDANKYIKASYYNSSCSAENIGSYTSYMAFIDSNGWLRKTSQANSKNWLGINDKVGSYAADTTWEKVNYFLKFYNSATALLQNAAGSNFIWTISSWSDARIKKNIKDTNVIGLEKINAIKIRQFDFKDEKRGTHKEIGYIAQELQEVVSDCVMNVPDKEFEDGLLYVEDKPLIPYLVKAVQELSAKVECLENKLKQMEELRNGKNN